jgi:glycine cleavage system H protein
MNKIPDEKKYSSNHIWIEMDDEFIGRCGLSEQFLEKLDRIIFIEFPDVGIEVRRGEKVARLESHIAFFDVISPVSGRITEINQEVLINPGILNTDPLKDGWIYKIEVKEPNEFTELMFTEEYSDYIVLSGDI